MIFQALNYLGEIYQMARLGRDERILNMKTGYRIGDNDPESLEIIGLWNEVYPKMGTSD